MTAEALFDGLAHAQYHGDTCKIVRLLSVLPREKQWEYAQWIQAHSPVKVGALKGKVFAKLRRRDDPLFREFALMEAVSALPELRHRGVPAQSELLPSKAFSEKVGEIKACIDRHRPGSSMSDAAIKQEALRALTHAEKHGDVRLMSLVVQQLPQGYWERGFRSWLYTFSPIRRDTQTGRFYQTKHDSPEFCEYDVVGAAAAAILPQRSTFNIRRLLDDRSYADWAHRLSVADHLEILAEFQDCASALVRESLQDSPSAQRILRAFASEWRSRSDTDDYFVWPSTYAVPGSNPLSAIEAPELGIFAALGYRVGRVRGQPDELRLFLLDQIFTSPLPPLNSADYMRPWGLPGTATRLRKMAYFLAQEIKNAKRKVVQDMSVAIAQWSSDHEYLYRKFYVGRFRFALARTPSSDFS
jgi:hypothetical protein